MRRQRAAGATPQGVLFISYDGLAEPLGQSQVLSYLVRLGRRYPVTLLSYEKRADRRNRELMRGLAQQLRAAGVRWIRLRYHKRPLFMATGWDIVQGLLVAAAACWRFRLRIVHARGYVPATIGWCLKRFCATKLLFDMRGFWADEKVEGGHWKRGALAYRLAKRWERRFFEEADALVSLTHAGVGLIGGLGYRMAPAMPIEVIPTCVDLRRFAPGPKDAALARQLGLEQARVVIGCVGNMSGWYLRSAMLAYLAFLIRDLEGAHVLSVTCEDHERLRADADAAGIPGDQMTLARAPFEAMPKYVRLMALGLFFIRPCFSKKASAATKLGEFLATGVPVVINAGIGDSGFVVQAHDVGVVLPDVNAETFAASRERVKTLLADKSCALRCRQTAQQLFDVEMGVAKYGALYRRLCGGTAA